MPFHIQLHMCQIKTWQGQRGFLLNLIWDTEDLGSIGLTPYSKIGRVSSAVFYNFCKFYAGVEVPVLYP